MSIKDIHGYKKLPFFCKCLYAVSDNVYDRCQDPVFASSQCQSIVSNYFLKHLFSISTCAMGCFQSREGDRRLVQFFPRPAAQGSGHDAELTRENLHQALTSMASYINAQRRGRQLTIVVVGGVVSTMLLRTRNSTQDIDFFNVQLSDEDASLLARASKVAQEQMTYPKLDDQWFNSRTTVFIHQPLRIPLVSEGLRQNVVVFSAPGLTLLAAPWAYQFCAKVDRIAGGGGKGHDALDAAGYLNRFLSSKSWQTIPLDRVRRLFHDYHLQRAVNSRAFPGAIQDVNDAYVKRWNTLPIIT